MPNFNSVTIVGHLTRDTELRYANSGVAICNFNVAVNHYYKDTKEASFIDVKCFGKMAESSNEYLAKGRAVLVSGELKQESWESKAGEKRSKLVVYANKVQFLSSPSGASPERETVHSDDIPF